MLWFLINYLFYNNRYEAEAEIKNRVIRDIYMLYYKHNPDIDSIVMSDLVKFLIKYVLNWFISGSVISNSILITELFKIFLLLSIFIVIKKGLLRELSLIIRNFGITRFVVISILFFMLGLLFAHLTLN